MIGYFDSVRQHLASRTQSQNKHNKCARETLIHRTYDILDTRNGFPGSGRGSGQTKVFKMLTGSPSLSPMTITRVILFFLLPCINKVLLLSLLLSSSLLL